MRFSRGKSRRLPALLALLLCLALLVPAAPARASETEAARRVEEMLACLMARDGAATVQEWLDGPLTEKAGVSSDSLVLALRQYRPELDYSAYAAQLATVVRDGKVRGASTRQRMALTLFAVGAGEDPYVQEVLADSLGQQGIMSWVYGLHLLNNGLVSPAVTRREVADTLLSQRLEDGGWALWGSVSDVDVTVMTVNALAPLAETEPDVRQAVTEALDLMGSRQLETGDFSSFGTDNPESTAQVVLALCALGIDPLTDSRFIKNGNTLLDGMNRYRLADGQYSHILGGDANGTATIQVFCALVGLWQQAAGRGRPYVFTWESEVPEPGQPEEPGESTEPVQTGETGEGPETGTAAEPEPPEETPPDTQPEQPENPGQEPGGAGATEPETGEGTKPQPRPEPGETHGGDAPETQTEPDPEPETPGKSKDQEPHAALKLWLIGGVCVLTAGILLWLFLSGKRRAGNYLFTLAVAALAIFAIIFTHIRTPQEYYGGAEENQAPAGAVTMTIRCDTLVGIPEAAGVDYIPADGVILPVTEFTFEEGDTVYDILVDAAREYAIQMESRNVTATSSNMAYVQGIAYLYEFDFGDLSGWIYRVNGITAGVGCGEYKVENGDRIEWLYTRFLGNDLDG